MVIIPVYNSQGSVSYTIDIDDTLEQIGTDRVSKGKNCYYKGVGVPYIGHWVELDKIIENEYEIREKNEVFYAGYFARKKCFKGKQGIFQENYWPAFDDFIGACGVRELSIIENSLEFAKSSVDLLDCVRHDEVNKQFYFKLLYKCNRVKYLQNGNPLKLIELMEYMIKENWNFSWDKNCISDISYNGLVTDVADLFVSKKIEEKIGTVYAIVYSLFKNDLQKYIDLINILELNTGTDSQTFVFNILKIVERFGYSTDNILIYSNEADNYRNIVLNYILQGKNCAHCGMEEKGEIIKQQYIENIKNRIGTIQTWPKKGD